MPVEFAAHITFYRINECGYYKRGEDMPVFGSVEALLADLTDWASTRKVIDTCTFQPTEFTSHLGVYLIGCHIHRPSGVRLVSLWNETPSSDGAVASIRLNSAVGAPSVAINGVESGSLPGYPTYFLVMPDGQRLATVRFGAQLSGLAGLRTYMRGFMQMAGRFVRFDDNDDELAVVGYAEDQQSPLMKCNPRFDVKLMTRAGARASLVQKAPDVTKVLRKAQLSMNVDHERKLWQKMLEFALLAPPQKEGGEVRVTYEVQASIDKDEMGALYDQWERDVRDENVSQWEDIGFRMKNESNPVWIGRQVARDKLQLPVQELEGGIFRGEVLVEELGRRLALLERITQKL